MAFPDSSSVLYKFQSAIFSEMIRVSAQKSELQPKNQSYSRGLAHQNRTIAIASDFRVDGAKSPEISQKEGVLGSEIATRNRKSLATFHRALKSQCSIAFSCLGNRCDFSGEAELSTSTVAALFSKMALTGQRIAMVDVVFLVFTALPYLP